MSSVLRAFLPLLVEMFAWGWMMIFFYSPLLPRCGLCGSVVGERLAGSHSVFCGVRGRFG